MAGEYEGFKDAAIDSSIALKDPYHRFYLKRVIENIF
jgi:hypothetical protein